MKKFGLIPIPFLVLILMLVGIYFIFSQNRFDTPEEIARKYNPLDATKTSPSPTPTPTPRPLTFAEMDALYGSCAYLPTLMYHHIQDMELAKTKNQQNLTVDTKTFREQMQYLKNTGYQTLSMADLTNFFDGGVAIPKKSLLLTFDDGYDDFATDALPILREFGFKATLFTPTGLMNNPGYLSWGTIVDISKNTDVEFANHTWSHKGMGPDGSIDEREISAADTQLAERGLNNPKIFAYPYGLISSIAEQLLSKYGYKAAFTTKHGSILCAKQRLELPRIRVGSAPLSSYGF